MNNLQAIETAFGCLVLGRQSQYDGSNTAPTRTIFVAQTDTTYYALRSQGTKPISRGNAMLAFLEKVEQNMTQFEFHQ